MTAQSALATATKTLEGRILTVRILKDNHSRDGWIAKTKKGKVCFIDNLGEVINILQPGQIWNATITRHKPTFLAITLDLKAKNSI